MSAFHPLRTWEVWSRRPSLDSRDGHPAARIVAVGAQAKLPSPMNVLRPPAGKKEAPCNQARRPLGRLAIRWQRLATKLIKCRFAALFGCACRESVIVTAGV